MKAYNNITKKTQLGLIIMAVLVLIGSVNAVVSALTAPNLLEFEVTLHWIADLIMYFLVILYAVFGYIKPHGNMLKYVFFVFGIYVLIHCIIPYETYNTKIIISNSLLGLSAMLIAYFAGRLNRIDKNKVLMVIIGIMLLASNIVSYDSNKELNIIHIIGFLTSLIIWAALCISYTARYEEHKAAGLE